MHHSSHEGSLWNTDEILPSWRRRPSLLQVDAQDSSRCRWIWQQRQLLSLLHGNALVLHSGWQLDSYPNGHSSADHEKWLVHQWFGILRCPTFAVGEHGQLHRRGYEHRFRRPHTVHLQLVAQFSVGFVSEQRGARLHRLFSSLGLETEYFGVGFGDGSRRSVSGLYTALRRRLRTGQSGQGSPVGRSVQHVADVKSHRHGSFDNFCCRCCCASIFSRGLPTNRHVRRGRHVCLMALLDFLPALAAEDNGPGTWLCSDGLS